MSSQHNLKEVSSESPKRILFLVIDPKFKDSKKIVIIINRVLRENIAVPYCKDLQNQITGIFRNSKRVRITTIRVSKRAVLPAQ